MDLKWWHYSQNNSGGNWYGPKHVVVQAVNGSMADATAENFAGVYFDGVATGQDCECCGDRWSPSWGAEGTEEPQVYDDAATACDDVLLVYADGRTEGGK
jgi:hypothetical protein